MQEGIQIKLNGESRSISSANVCSLLEELSLAGKKVAVELNKEIVPRDKYQETKISTGDVIEVIHFVGGG